MFSEISVACFLPLVAITTLRAAATAFIRNLSGCPLVRLAVPGAGFHQCATTRVTAGSLSGNRHVVFSDVPGFDYAFAHRVAIGGAYESALVRVQRKRKSPLARALNVEIRIYRKSTKTV